MKKTAIYPGSFDPVTYGHLDVIKRAVSIFGKVTVAVSHNTNKKYLFSLKERAEMLKEVTKDIKGVNVETFDGLTTQYVKKKKTNILVRGLRMTSDFDYEFQMALTNRRLDEEVETAFLMPSERFTFLSSSLLREVARLGGDVSSFVPSFVEKRLRVKLKDAC